MPERFQSSRWDGVERRDQETRLPTAPMRAMEIEALVTRYTDANRDHFDGRMDDLEKSLTTLIKSAFPDNDPAGHRRAHEAQIKNADWWDRVKTEMFINAAKSGVWLALIWMAYAAWEHLKDALKK